jgi:hypothetical protein
MRTAYLSNIVIVSNQRKPKHSKEFIAQFAYPLQSDKTIHWFASNDKHIATEDNCIYEFHEKFLTFTSQ